MKATQTTPRQREKEATRRAENAAAELEDLRHALQTYHGWLRDRIDEASAKLRQAQRRKQPDILASVRRSAYASALIELETFTGPEAQR